MLSVSMLATFPELVEHALDYGVTGRARERGLWRWRGLGLHEFASDARKSIDARPAAGGPGMVLMPGPLDRALAAATVWHGEVPTVVFLSPDGAPLTQARVRDLAQCSHVCLVAGRYEGIDQRWIDANVDAVVSLGDYVLSGGELAAAVVVDACVRLLPGALGDKESTAFESFADSQGGRLDWPQYALTCCDMALPPGLTGGDHAVIQRWRLKQALARTWRRRPDLLARANLSLVERALIDEIALESKA
ncbi:MAG: tRNA (guanosine(37)-N1)-methyltransferase TrmD [Burkholderiales bacterium]|nr:tRNA (guanosine(37)-N1)-methyltransferase TrmD [Burkholderiales bacterium]